MCHHLTVLAHAEMDGDVIFVRYFGKNDAAFQQLLLAIWRLARSLIANR